MKINKVNNRIYLASDDFKGKMHPDLTGIKTYNFVIGFIFSLFGRSLKIKSSNGKTYFIKKKSAIKWLRSKGEKPNKKGFSKAEIRTALQKASKTLNQPRVFRQFKHDIGTDFSYTPPKVDLPKEKVSTRSSKAEKKLNKKVEQRCMDDFKEAMGHLDFAIGEACESLIQEELLPFIKEFDDRTLKVYETLAEIEAEDHLPLLPPEISALKQGSMVTEDIVHAIKILKKKQSKEILSAKEKIDLFKFRIHLKMMGQNLDKDLKSQLLNVDLEKGKNATPRERLLNEISGRVLGDTGGSGDLGTNPLSVLQTLKGKYDTPDNLKAAFRTRNYFIYQSNTLFNVLMRRPKLMKRMNQKFKENGVEWELDTELANYCIKRSSSWKIPNNLVYKRIPPLFNYGAFSKHNLKIRKKRSKLEKVQIHKESPNPTFQEAEQRAFSAITRDNSKQRYKTTFTPAEITGSLGGIEYLEKKDGGIEQVSSKADTGFGETPLNYRKRTTKVSWWPGKYVYKVKQSEKDPYLKGAQDLGLTLIAGISGTMDQSSVMAQMVGLNKPEHLQKILLNFLAWMIPAEDHSAHEILTSAKTFGFDYRPSPDFYKQIRPGDEELVSKIEENMEKRGLKLPDYYLSKEYAKKIKEELEQEERLGTSLKRGRKKRH